MSSMQHQVRILWFLLFASVHVFAVDPVQTKTLSLSPSSNNASWAVSLPPNFTATLTVNISQEAEVNTTTYKLDPKSVKAAVSSSTPSLAWVTQTSGATVTASITNSSNVEASSVVKVTCAWTPAKAGGGGGGAGPATITGLATASAKLSASSVVWEITDSTQIADGNGEMSFKATLVDSNGNKLPFTSVPTVTPASIDPADAAWAVEGLQLTDGSATGKVKSAAKKKSTGNLALTYGQVTSNSPTLSFFWVWVEVTKPTVISNIYNKQTVIDNPDGTVTVIPASLYIFFDRIAQSIKVDPPDAADMSAYTITQTLLAGSGVYYDDNREPNTNKTSKVDGQAPASQILYDLINAPQEDPYAP